MSSRAEKVFGIFEDKLPRYYNTEIIRISQVQMAMHISNFLHPRNPQKFLFIEAPVGTGKSLGALVPSLLERNMSLNKRILYATSTINLQGQLMRDEVPLLKKLKLVNNVVLAKGKAHSYCRKEYIANRNMHPYRQHAKEFEDFFQTSETGYRDDFEARYFSLSNPAWARLGLRASKKGCEACDFSRFCPTILHRNKFLLSTNELIITNHDQLIRSFINKMREWSPIVPVDPGIIILDEAHDFQENFLNQSKQEVSLENLRQASRFLISEKSRPAYKTLVQRLENTLQKELKQVESMQGRYPVLAEAAEILVEIRQLLIKSEEDSFIQQQFRNRLNDEEPDEVEQLIEAIEQLLDTDGHVAWVDYEEMKFASISRTYPTNFRRMLDFVSRRNKVIIMSGTLTGNGDFSTVLQQWRLDRNSVETISVPTAFQYEHQALMYVPKNLVMAPKNIIHEEKYINNQVENINKLVSQTGGRTLILTTSKAHMEKLHDRLAPTLSAQKILFLKQDTKSVEQLADQFKKDETSVLIGSGSFYSGLSVPGRSLVSVIITKLPFPVPDDPFLELIGEGYEDDFFNFVAFPHMMIRLQQAVGRLIRDLQDFGLITFLDPRVFQSNFGKAVRDAMETMGYRFTRSWEQVVTFYKEKEHKGNSASYPVYNRTLIEIPEFCGSTMQQVRPVNTPAPSVSTPKVQTEKKKRERKPPRQIDHITEEQWQFYEQIVFQRTKQKPMRISSLQDSDDVYQFLYNLYYHDKQDPAVIVENFPFTNDSQRQRLQKFKGSLSRIYIMTPEERAALEERIAKKNAPYKRF